MDVRRFITPQALTAVAVALAACSAIGLCWRSVLRPAAATPPPLELAPATAPAADLSPVGTPPIRVCVTNGPAAEVALQIVGAYELRAVGDAQRLDRGQRLGPTVARAADSGLRLGDHTWHVSRLEIIPEKSPGVWIDGRLYRGSVCLFRQPDDRVLAVNVVPLEDYVAAVVDGEMPARFPDAARQAQAVVARTFALARMERAAPDALFDVYASERSQKYLGVEYSDAAGRRLAGESASSRQIARDTRGVVVTYQGRVFPTYYSACCGGATTTGTLVFPDAAAPVRSVPCEFCRDARRYRWSDELSVREFLQVLERTGRSPALKSLKSIRQVAGPGGGGLAQFECSDGQRTLAVSGADLRQAWPNGGLFSPHFSLRLDGQRVLVEGRGHGHGVGLCQWGARGQALEGRTAMQILRHYYPGADFVRVTF